MILSNVFSLSEIISIWNNWVIVEILKMKRIDLIKKSRFINLF